MRTRNPFARKSTWISLVVVLLLVPILPLAIKLLTANTDPDDWPNTSEFGYYGDLHRVKRLIMESGCAEAIEVKTLNRDLLLEDVVLNVKTKAGNRRLRFDASQNYGADVKQQINQLCQPIT
jgi:hypothetical protein